MERAKKLGQALVMTDLHIHPQFTDFFVQFLCMEKLW